MNPSSTPSSSPKKTLGQKIHSRRTELGLSLRELGDLTGLTASFLSQVENDLSDPSISSLQRIAGVLRAQMFAFLESDSQTEEVVRAGARKRLSFPEPHLTYELLSNNLNRQMTAFVIRLKAGEKHAAQTLYRPTEEIMFVIQGEMLITIGERIHHLKPGDSIYYEGAQLHQFESIGTDELIVHCAMTPPSL